MKSKNAPILASEQHKKAHTVSRKFPYFHLIYALGAPAHRLTNVRITLLAFGEKPTIDLPLRVFISQTPTTKV